MKKLLYLAVFYASLVSCAYAADLIEVYQQALVSDPTYQAAMAQQLSDQEGVPISLSSLFPASGASVAPFLQRSLTSGPASIGSDSQRGYNVDLTLTQTIFNYAQFKAVSVSRDVARQASATFNAATQDLMVRVAKAYFNILQDEDNLRYIRATRNTYAKQLDQVKQQYQVGLKTVTDVYTAEASYQSSVAEYIAAENQLDNDRENLRAITGHYYPSIAKLKDNIPLVKPVPANIEAWAKSAEERNWSVKASKFAMQAARQRIKQQFAGHLPTLNVQGDYAINFSRNTNGEFGLTPAGSSQAHVSTLTLNLAIPLVQGGLVVAQTRQAQYNFQVAVQQLEYNLRNTANLARQSYLGVIAGISKIAADKKAIQSSISSYEGMEAGYKVGTEILVNVLDQQQKVVQAQQQYASDRYAYVNNLLSLKQAAGTLSPEDLLAINAWLKN